MAACTLLPSPPHNPSHSSSSSLFFSLQVARGPFSLRTQPLCSRVKRLSVSAPERALDALIFDCDGVILESKHLHLQAYNDTFSHFSVRCTSSPSSQPPRWDAEFYDDLQNRIGRGKPKMRWYFKEHGWPTSAIFDEPPEDDSDREKLIDTLQGKKLVVCSAATKSSVILVLENLIGTEAHKSNDNSFHLGRIGVFGQVLQTLTLLKKLDWRT